MLSIDDLHSELAQIEWRIRGLYLDYIRHGHHTTELDKLYRERQELRARIAAEETERATTIR